MKKGLLITLAIILVLAGGGYGAYYYLTNKDVAPAEIGVADDFFDFDILIEDSVETPPASDKSTPSANSGSATEQVEPALGNKQDPDQDSTNKDKTTQAPDQAKPVKDEPVTEDSIRAKYEPKFLALEDTALSRLDTLKENAWAEYQRNKAGESSSSLVDISSIYMSAGNKLQSKVDNAFYALLEKMKQELTDADLSMDLLNETELHYHQTIRSKKSEIMSKATDIMG